MEKVKPSFEEVYAYAKKSVTHYLRKLAHQLPYEQKEEIEQNAMLRAWQAYQELDAEKGWKSFIQLHCRGAVLDYLKGGDRNTEAELDLERVETSYLNDEKAYLDVENIVAYSQVAIHDNPSNSGSLNAKWELLERMAPRDENLHIVAKVLLGFSQDSISKQFESSLGTALSRERISQRIYEFFELLDSPDNLRDPWVNQCIFALGLSDHYHMEEFDNGTGWDLERIDLRSIESFGTARSHYHPNLFDYLKNQ